MAADDRRRWRSVLPWVVSAGLLVYVFGWATDWVRLRDALRAAHVPAFLLFATIDRLAFFAVWTWLQAYALRRFVSEVPTRSVFAVRGGSELIRTVSNPASDAAFFLGLAHLSGGRIDAVISAALVPAFVHVQVMLGLMTLALPFLPGGPAQNRGTWTTAGILWLVVFAIAVAVRLSGSRKLRLPGIVALRNWLERFSFRDLRPFYLGFLGLTLFDVLIQGLASRAFGIPIDWVALAARLPLLYLALTIPTLGNFGTREVAWASLFADFGDRDRLIAYALGVNAVFLVINLVIGLIFLPRALQLIAAVRSARREGAEVPEPILHDPTDL
ncbi:MAG TPA: lysylphosphatidylglycerol synthase domain-containing protein [Myxococcota bacterium]